MKKQVTNSSGRAMPTKTSAVALTMIAASLFVRAAYAHAELRSTEPAAGVTTTASPKQIRIMFNENVIQHFSGVELKDQAGKVVVTGKASTDPSEKKMLVVPVEGQLAPGDYRVEWHVVSEDTHRVKGAYSFSVGR
jgi:methionine-rich copper-binding protein CopC